MAHPLLDAFEQKLRAVLHGTTLDFTSALLAELDLAAVPAGVIPPAGFALRSTLLSRLSDTALGVRGTFDHPTLGAVGLDLAVDATGAKLAGTLELTPPAGATLATVTALLGTGAAALQTLLQDAAARRLDFRNAAGTLQLRVVLAGAHDIVLGPLRLTIALDHAAIALAPLALSSVSGRIRFGHVEVPVIVPLDGTSPATVALGSLTLEDLLAELGLGLPALPPLPLLSQSLDRLTLRVVDGDFFLATEIPWPGLGTATITLASDGGAAGVVAGLTPASPLKFSSLDAALAPLDAVLGIVTFGSPPLLLSTLDAPSFPVADATGNITRMPVRRGLTFLGDLELSGFGLDLLANLLGRDELPFTLPVTPNLADLKITVAHPATLDVLPGVLQVSDFALELTPQPLDVLAEGVAALTVFGEKLPRLILGGALTPPDFRVFLRAADPWKHPAGLPVDIDEFGLQVSGPVTEFGVFGKITLGTRSLSVATAFVGSAPTFLAASLQGNLSFRSLLKDFTGLDVPLDLGASIRDASVYVVLKPTGETILGRHYPAGLGLAGFLSVLGLEMSIFLSADIKGVVAKGELTSPVRMAPFLELTGAGGVGVPSFALDTGGNPLATLSGRVQILGLIQEVQGKIGDGVVSFSVLQQLGPVRAQLAATLADGRFQAAGQVAFGLHTSVGPLQLAPGGPSLGTLQLDAQLAATATIDAGPGPAGRVQVLATFDVLGLHIALPLLDITVPSLDQLPQAIIAYVQAHAAELFQALLTNADAWLRALAQGAITLVANVAAVLIDHFGRSVDEAAAALRNTLNRGAADIARELNAAGKALDQIAGSLAALSDPPAIVRGALEAIGAPAAEVSRAMQRAFPGIPHIDGPITPHVDTPLVPHVDVAPVHTDVAPVHADVTTSHGDTTGPHTDGTGPHVDASGFGIHTDIGGVHGDVGGLHADVGGIHTDLITTPHADMIVSPHVDTPAAAHVDVPSIGHIDTP